jgi:hypothetical protein
VSKQTLPFVLMNFTGRFRDVITLRTSSAT